MPPERGARVSAAVRELSRLDGNRIWRVETASGPVLQKLYAERGSWLHGWARELASRLRGGKTGTRAEARRETEARMLALWRAHGCDVPAELSAQHPELADERTLVLEFVEGPLLSELLADAALPREQRDRLLERYAADLAARHGLALRHLEAALVQEHAGVQHVLVSQRPGAEPRFVGFDLENAFAPCTDVAPLVAKEIAGAVRSLARCGRPDADRLRLDVQAFVRGYGDRARLQSAVDHYLRPASPLWRAVWSLDRRREQRSGRKHGKFVMLELLDGLLKPPAS